MTIHLFFCNPYREATYLVYDPAIRRAIVIDAGMYDELEQQRFAKFVEEEKLQPVALLITHTHPDHICGVEWLQQTYGLKPIVQPAEGPLTLDGFDTPVEVIATPGHKEDCVCYYLPTEGVLFSGDTLFQESIGRTDLPGGDMNTLLHSLKRLTQLPPKTIVYPGHGYTTTIEHEIKYNPYF